MSGAERLRVGIAGYGRMGRLRRTCIDEHPRLRTSAVADRDPRCNPKDGARFTTDVEELFDGSLDALFVCLPPGAAAAVTESALGRGLDVFCEKPPARTVAELVRVRDVERANPERRLAYGFNHRHHGSVRRALELIQSRELGEPVNARGIYGKPELAAPGGWRGSRDVAGGGILLDQGIHLVDLVRLLVGEVETVQAYVTPDRAFPEVDGDAQALLRTESGAVAMLHSSAAQWPPRFALHVNLTAGSLELDGILSQSGAYGPETLTVHRRGASAPEPERSVYDQDHSFRDEVAAFAQILESRGPVVHGSSIDALRTMQLVEQIYAAGQESMSP